jgi:hypothetical protein
LEEQHTKDGENEIATHPCSNGRAQTAQLHWYKPDEIWLSNHESMHHLENEVKKSCAKALCNRMDIDPRSDIGTSQQSRQMNKTSSQSSGAASS